MQALKVGFAKPPTWASKKLRFHGLDHLIGKGKKSATYTKRKTASTVTDGVKTRREPSSLCQLDQKVTSRPINKNLNAYPSTIYKFNRMQKLNNQDVKRN